MDIFLFSASVAVITLLSYYAWVVLDAHKESRLEKRFGCRRPRRIYRPLAGIPASIELVNALTENRWNSFVRDLFVKYGNTFIQGGLGKQNLWSCEPANVKEVLSTQFKNFILGDVRADMAKPMIGKGVFTSDGKEWAHYRSMIRPSFNRHQINDLPMWERHIQNLFARIREEESGFDIQELFHEYTMDISTEFLFGFSASSLLPDADSVKKNFSNAFKYASGKLIARSIMGPFVHVFPDAEFWKSVKTIHSFIDGLVAKSMAARARAIVEKKEGTRYVYLYEMAEITKDPIELRSNALHILFAGRDTTASALSFGFYLLARHPRVWEKLYSEVEGKFEGRLPAYEDLKGLKYVNHTIHEILRLYPSVPFNSRTAVDDTTLPVGGGPLGRDPILVRKGDVFVYSVSAMHRRKDIWGDDAEEFRPERWEGQQPGPEFLPFQSGPRICLGQGFAMAELAYTITRLVQTFKNLEPWGEGELIEKQGAVMSSANGVWVGLNARR